MIDHIDDVNYRKCHPHQDRFTRVNSNNNETYHTSKNTYKTQVDIHTS